MYDTQTRKKDEHGEPALANTTIPATANNYYWVLLHDEPANNVEEPISETKYDDSFGIDFLGY